MADLPPLDIDPAGDLVLSVGLEEQQNSMRVSSKTLSLASPVLAAMLGPRFAEGQESCHRDWTVSLPEDDPEAMSYICLALHYQQDFNRVVSLSLLEKVAVLSDKYNFTVALRASSELALQTLMINVKEPKTYTMLLNVSYALDGHQAFWKSTYWLLFQSASVDDIQTSSSGSLLPNHLLATIIAGRENILVSLQKSAENAIDRWIQRKDDMALKTTSHYLSELSRLGLWPPTEKFQRSSVQTVLTKFRQYSTCSSPNCACDYYGGIPKILQTAAEEFEKPQNGLCLRCVKKGFVLRQDGNCGTGVGAYCSKA